MTRFFTLASLAVAAFMGVASASTETISITIVAVNDGGSSQTQQMSSTTTTPGTTHQVTVGGAAGLVYTPNTLSAAVGDLIQFNFMSANHTVTQSSFNTPCVKMANGVDSGFMANPNNTVNPPPMMMFQVMTTDPIWMYCRQTGHCGKGMVFSVNPTAAKSQADFSQLAISQNGTATTNTTTASTTTASAASVATSTTSSSSSSSSVVAGTASTDSTGQCSCACLCGAADFPAGAGVGATGGISGSISVSQVGIMGKRSIPMIH